MNFGYSYQSKPMCVFSASLKLSGDSLILNSTGSKFQYAMSMFFAPN